MQQETIITFTDNVRPGMSLVVYRTVKSGVTQYHFALRTDYVGKTIISSAAEWINSQDGRSSGYDEKILLSTKNISTSDAERKCFLIAAGIAELCGLCALYSTELSHIRVLFSSSDELPTCNELGWREIPVAIISHSK